MGGGDVKLIAAAGLVLACKLKGTISARQLLNILRTNTPKTVAYFFYKDLWSLEGSKMSTFAGCVPIDDVGDKPVSPAARGLIYFFRKNRATCWYINPDP